MKRFAVLPALLALLAMAALPHAAAAAPAISFETTTIELPAASEGEFRDAVFTFTNSGDQVLKIMDVKASCGCTAPRFDREVPPGKTGTVTLQLDTLGILGDYKKTAKVFTNADDQKPIQLTISGRVNEALVVEGGRGLTLVGCQGEEVKAGTILRPMGEGSLEIESVETPLERVLEAKATPLKEGGAWRLDLTAKTRQAFQATGPVYINLAGGLKSFVWVDMEVRSQVNVTPRNLNYGNLRLGDDTPQAKVVVVLRACASELSLQSMEYDQEKLTVTPIWHEMGQILLLVVSPRLDKLQPGPLESEILLTLSDETVKVRVLGFVR